MQSDTVFVTEVDFTFNSIDRYLTLISRLKPSTITPGWHRISCDKCLWYGEASTTSIILSMYLKHGCDRPQDADVWARFVS